MKLYRTTDFQVRRKSRRTRMSVVHRVDFYLPLALKDDLTRISRKTSGVLPSARQFPGPKSPPIK